MILDQLIFVTDRTKKWLTDNIYPCTNSAAKKHVQVHLKQHMVHMFCPCGYSNTSRDSVYDHQSSHQAEGHPGHGPRAGYIYQVDYASYHRWTELMRWTDHPRFPDPHPTLRGDSRPPPPGAFTERMAQRRQKREARQARKESKQRAPVTEVRRISGPTEAPPTRTTLPSASLYWGSAASDSSS